MLKRIGDILFLTIELFLSLMIAGLNTLMALTMYYIIFVKTNTTIMPFWLQVAIFVFMVGMWIMWGFIIFVEQFKLNHKKKINN